MMMRIKAVTRLLHSKKGDLSLKMKSKSLNSMTLPSQGGDYVKCIGIPKFLILLGGMDKRVCPCHPTELTIKLPKS